MSHLKEENKRDMKPLLVMKEESLPEHQEQNLSVDQEDVKEEEEKLWISQQGEQLQQLEEADLTKFGFTSVTVKSENEDEEPESSQLHQSQSVHPGTSGRSSDSSGTETDDSSDWKQTRELHSHFNCQKNISIVHSSNCNIAEKTFNCSIHLKASDHMNNSKQHKQASVKPFSCSDQSKRQEQKGSLNRNIIHPQQKQYGCSECGRNFVLKGNLKTHMIIHTGQKQFGCSECGRRFGLKSNLKKHMIIHTGQKQFGCSECGRRFGLKCNLKTHMIIHSGQKQFVCSECGQRFSQNSHLKSHMINHTGQRHFACSECGKRFGERSQLNRHTMNHTGQKPFVCSECDRRFGLKSSLNRHMRIHTTSAIAEGRLTEMDIPSYHQSADPGPEQPQWAKRN